MTPDELVRDLEQRAAHAERIGAQAPVAAIYRLVLEEVGQLDGTPEERTPDRLLSAEVAAERMGVSKRYIYNHADTLPFTKRLGRTVRFSERGLERWLNHK